MPDERDQPSDLAARATRALDLELREAVGDSAREAELPPDAPFWARLSAGRIAGGIALAVAVVIGAILALLVGSWWVLAGALLVHLAVTAVVATLVVRTTTEVENPSVGTAERLEAAGVRDPEYALNRAVERATGESSGSGVFGVLTTGNNERSVRPPDDPARATAEQRTAMTPSSDPLDTEPTEGPNGAEPPHEPSPVLMPSALYAGLAVLTLAIPLFAGGGNLWLTPAICMPLILLAAFLHVRMFAGGGRSL